MRTDESALTVPSSVPLSIFTMSAAIAQGAKAAAIIKSLFMLNLSD
jgi:hypothetical protein